MPNVIVITQPIRECGERTEHSFYLTTGESSPDGILAATSEIDTPIPMQRKPHRGPIIVDGDAILERKPEREWLAGSSDKSADERTGLAWEIETFGMPLSKRVSFGECKGAQDAAEAYTRLEQNIRFNSRMLEYVRTLSVNGVQELPGGALPYNRMVRALQSYAMEKQASCLLEVSAAVWQLADKIKVTNKDRFNRDLASMLSLLGFPHDAVMLLKMYA